MYMIWRPPKDARRNMEWTSPTERRITKMKISIVPMRSDIEHVSKQMVEIMVSVTLFLATGCFKRIKAQPHAGIENMMLITAPLKTNMRVSMPSLN